MKSLKDFLIERAPPPGKPRPGDVLEPDEAPEVPTGVSGAVDDEFGDATKTYFKNTFAPIIDYFKELQASREAASSENNRLAAELETFGNDPTAWAKDKLETGTDTLLHSAVNKARKGTAFLNNFIAQTKKELNTAKIPNTPKADIGKAPGLRKRVNTKGF